MCVKGRKESDTCLGSVGRGVYGRRESGVLVLVFD